DLAYKEAGRPAIERRAHGRAVFDLHLSADPRCRQFRRTDHDRQHVLAHLREVVTCFRHPHAERWRRRRAATQIECRLHTTADTAYGLITALYRCRQGRTAGRDRVIRADRSVDRVAKDVLTRQWTIHQDLIDLRRLAAVLREKHASDPGLFGRCVHELL